MDQPMPYESMSQPSAPPALPFELRPLTTGEVLDRSLSLYRSHFAFCIGLTLLSAMVALLSGLVRVLYIQIRHLPPTTGATNSVFLLITTIVGTGLAYAAHGFVSAALNWGTGSVYLGRAVSLSAAFRVARQHWLRYALLSVVQLLVSSWVTLVLYAAVIAAAFATRGKSAMVVGALVGLFTLLAVLSVPYSLYRYIQVSLALPASVLEGLGIRDALRRSRALLPDRKGRIFLLFLLIGALYLVVGSAVGVLSLFAIRGSIGLVVVQLATLLTTFLGTLLLQPFFTIALCLLYYDERVRREGFDIEFLMAQAASLPADDFGGR